MIPEINAQEIENRPRGIIANPNCSTIIGIVPVWPLHKANPVKRMVVSTYQAAKPNADVRKNHHESVSSFLLSNP